MDLLPEILLTDHSGLTHALDLDWLDQLSRSALPKVVARQRPQSVLLELEEIEITLVDDATIAQVHGQFMDIPEPTDVITFHHGEVLISVDTALRQANEYERSLRDEVALYMIHGLLHLAGYLDKTPEDFKQMAAIQEGVLEDCLAAK